MTDELLTYYNRELGYFRRMAAEFAEANPKIAARLRLGPDTSEDPHVERLIEAFAYLNARIRFKLEDDFPEISDAFLSVLYPHYLAPIPSSTIVQFVLDPAQSALVAGYNLDTGSALETEPIQGEPCRFQTCYPVTLWPVEVATAGLYGRPFPAPMTPRSGDAVAVVKLKLSCLSDELSVGQVLAGSYRFFLKGQPQHVFRLYELLFNNTIEVALARAPNDPQPIVLKPDCLQPVGFEADDGMLPYSARSALGYRLLTEYFIFPQRFLFFDLTGLEALKPAGFGQHLEVYIYLNRTSLDLEQNVSADTFQLGCTPAVNLFRQRAEPIQLTHETHEYRIVPDARRPQATEVYSVDGVAATAASGAEMEYRPFYSIDHSGRRDAAEAYWYASRRTAEHGGDFVDDGTEVFLSFVDLGGEAFREGDWYVDVATTCLNRDLPGRLPFGGDQPRLYLSEGTGPVSIVRCLTAPTPTVRPQRQRGAIWKLISHLTLGHLSIVDGPEGAAALREVLRLYDFQDSADTRSMIDGILSVGSRRITARVPGEGGVGFCRGIEVEIEFDEARFSENEVYLFACILERFLALHCSLNSFTALNARLKGREGSLRRWPPRSGEKALLLNEQIFTQPWRYDFFQAVRLLERWSREQPVSDRQERRQPVGGDAPPGREAVRFRVLPSRVFPGSNIHRLTRPAPRDAAAGKPAAAAEMTITFLGLTGSNGVLPQHYTTLLLSRIRNRDHVLRDFLDLFHHRTISLFYRAWQKYRFQIGYEAGGPDPDPEDLFTQCLAAFIGLGTSQTRHRAAYDDRVYLHYSGLFSQRTRSSLALERMLSEQFQLPIRVQQFQGQWLLLNRADRSRLPGGDSPEGQFQQLGKNVVLGERIWDVQSKFRLVVGPLNYQQFCTLMPCGDTLLPLVQLARTYAGIEFDFDVQLRLKSAEVPPCRLGGEDSGGIHLGWNSWLGTREGAGEAGEAIFGMTND